LLLIKIFFKLVVQQLKNILVDHRAVVNYANQNYDADVSMSFRETIVHRSTVN